MKLSKIFLFLLILPLTILLDLILFAFLRTCPTCGSFSQFIKQEGALSFPLVIGIAQWLEQFVSRRQSHVNPPSQKLRRMRS